MAKSHKPKTPRKKVVLASGVFDLLHLGHVRFLEEAKKAGGPNAELLVIVARDKTVQERKGRKPVVPESQRCALVASLKIVDKAILGYEDFNMGEVIEKINPDVIALGYDSYAGSIGREVEQYVRGKNLKIKVVKVGHFREDDLDSSSKIKQKIIEDYAT
jgi:FAD synthetase